jgi:cell division protein FtsQ
MNVRARLAHLLKRQVIRREPRLARLRASAAPETMLRWERLGRRWLPAILEFQPPRGAGASAAAMLILAATVYGAVRGGHGRDIAEQVQSLCDAAANSVGFRISEVALSGEHQVSREDILGLAGITDHSSLLFLDPAQVRAQLLTNPWIAEATVLKLYPGRLRIGITERQAFALWQQDSRLYLIAADGTVLEAYVPQRFATLPLVVGRGAEQRAVAFLNLVARYPDIAKRVEASVLVADRRWNLHLKGGVEVLLPENEPAHALQLLVDLDRDKKLLSRDIVEVDLRLTDRVTVRLSDAAAAARAAALKAAEKSKKAKGKGGEA